MLALSLVAVNTSLSSTMMTCVCVTHSTNKLRHSGKRRKRCSVTPKRYRKRRVANRVNRILFTVHKEIFFGSYWFATLYRAALSCFGERAFLELVCWITAFRESTILEFCFACTNVLPWSQF